MAPVPLAGEYLAVCCQMETENAVDADAVERNLRHVEEMIDWAVEGYMTLDVPVGLVVFPELSIHGAAGYSWAEQRRVAVELPGPELDRLAAKAREYAIHLVPGSLVEHDPETGALFNTLPLLSPRGELLWRYRKVNVWYPLEPAQSPVDLLPRGYDLERFPLFPVAQTPLGNLGGYVCYDGLFPEVTRQLAANGAEVLVRASAFMDPWGTGPTGACALTDRVRALENMAYGVSCQQGASLRSSPPYSWPGGSCVVDFEGRLLAQAERGEQILAARVDPARVRAFRRRTLTHNLLSQNRPEAYDFLSRPAWPPRPDLGRDGDVHVRDYEHAARAAADGFWSRYYGEPVGELPSLSAPFWRAQRERAARAR